MSTFWLIKGLVPLAIVGLVITLMHTFSPVRPARVAQTTSITYRAVADAYVNKASPGTNYGASTVLRVDNSPVNHGYLRFDVTGLDNVNNTKATLKIFANSSQDSGLVVTRLSNDTWNEDTINYRNAPVPGSVIHKSGPVKGSSWVTIDVTSIITGDGDYDLALTTSSSTALSLASRESGAHAPQLLISFSASSGEPTATSSITPTTGAPSVTPTQGGPSATPTLTLTSSGPSATATRTTTSGGPSATPTRTPTSGGPTATPTRTPTPSGPTATPTITATITPATATPTVTATSGGGGSGSVPKFSHVIVMVFENEEYSSIIGQSSLPNFNNLARQYALLTNDHAVGHPSLPNYIALTSGDTQGINSDCGNCSVNVTNIADLVESSGRTWKAYLESMPSDCFLTSGSDYTPNHNPFVHFNDIRNSATRCQQHDVPLTQLDIDLQNRTLPSFAWISPNLCDSGHDCGAAGADKFLGPEVSKITSSPAFDQNSLLIVTFDEGDTGASCCGLPGSAGGRIATILISGLVKPGFQDATPYSHYSVLKTIEESWGLAKLGHSNDAQTSVISSVWK